jgi:ankyrin repeat protein
MSDALADHLCEAAESRSSLSRLHKLLSRGADPNAHEGTDRATPLIAAARRDLVPNIRVLVAAGARVDGCDADGWTPLMFAAFGRAYSAIDALVAAGADVDRAARTGDTALHVACTVSHAATVRTLLRAGARPALRNRSKRRPADEVRRRGREGEGGVSLRVAAAGAQLAIALFAGSPGAILDALAAAEPWGRRRAAGLACYGDAWEWKA